MKALNNNFDIYNENNTELKTKDDILNNATRKFIIKEKKNCLKKYSNH